MVELATYYFIKSFAIYTNANIGVGTFSYDALELLMAPT